MNSKKQMRLDMLIVFLIALLPRLLLIFLYAEPFRTPMDEMSTISTAAYFGGKDWTALTSYAKFYYGGGFTILFAPLFRITSNYQILYYTMLAVCAVLQSVSAPISYTIMRKYLKVDRRSYVMVGSIACSYFVISRSMEVFNEHIIIACVWVVTWLICRLYANRDNYMRKAIDSVIIMLILSYALTTHTRTKVMWIAFAIVVIAYYWIYKRCFVAVIPTIVTGVIGYIGAQKFIEMIKVLVWRWQEGDYLRNTSVELNLSLSDLKNPVSWQGIFGIALGQTNTLLVFSGGILAIIVVMFVKLYWDTAVVRIRKKSQSDIGGSNDAKPILLVVSAMFLMCTAAVIAAQSLTWLSQVMSALTDHPYNSNVYGYKAITYMRYCGPFMAPVFMTGIAYIYHEREKIRKYIFPTIALTGMLQLIWIAFILPHISKSRTASEVFVAFGGFHICEDAGMRARVYLMGSVVLLVLFGISIICYMKKKILVPLILVLALLGYEYAYGAIYWDGAWADTYASRVEDSTELMQKLIQNQEEVPKEIYVYDTTHGVQKTMYIFQMILNDYTILPSLPVDTASEAIAFCKEENEELTECRYRHSVMSDGMHLYVLGDEYINIFEKYGIIFDN